MTSQEAGLGRVRVVARGGSAAGAGIVDPQHRRVGEVLDDTLDLEPRGRGAAGSRGERSGRLPLTAPLRREAEVARLDHCDRRGPGGRRTTHEVRVASGSVETVEALDHRPPTPLPGGRAGDVGPGRYLVADEVVAVPERVAGLDQGAA